jgi:hypothetical protein
MTTEPTHLLRVAALALACYREARGESLLGILLVAQTIENRVNDARWPDTYIGVVTLGGLRGGGQLRDGRSPTTHTQQPFPRDLRESTVGRSSQDRQPRRWAHFL